jgi:hypothetical protein
MRFQERGLRASSVPALQQNCNSCSSVLIQNCFLAPNFCKDCRKYSTKILKNLEMC